MSQENVEVVSQMVPPKGTDYTQLIRDDAAWAALAKAAASIIDPELEGAFIAWGQRMIEFTGVDGLRDAWLQWLAPWASYYEDVEDVFAVGPDRVVVLGREHGYRRDMERDVAAEAAGVYHLRDGRVVTLEYYADRAEALEAVGLAE
jgi:ketosteroid isomerase-like protein